MRRLYLLVALVLVIGGCAPLDRPPANSVFEDEDLERQVIAQINRLHTGKVHVNVTSFNRRLLLTGEVPSEASKSEIEKIVSGVPKVKAINNELVVGNLRGIPSRTTDSWITSDVKYSFINKGSFRAGDIKVTTENGTVYLMGTVHRKEGAAAAELASATKRVQRVILLFEYLD